MAFLELLFQWIIFDVIHFVGIAVRWGVATLLFGEERTFTQYRKRYQRQRDPSNTFSDGIIRLLIGCGVLGVAVYGIVAIFS